MPYVLVIINKTHFFSPLKLAGESKGYHQRALLIYDGIHYDPLVLESSGGKVLRRLFSIDDDAVLIQAQQMARDAFEARYHSAVQYLDNIIIVMLDWYFKGW